MTAITFDTLKFANRLKSAGVPDKQAEAQAEISDKSLEDLATKRDLKELETSTSARLVELELRLIKWMIALLAGQGAMVITILKLFPGK